MIELRKYYGTGVVNNFIELKGDYLRWVPDVAEVNKIALSFLKLVKENPSHAERINEKLLASIASMNAYSQELLSTDFSTKTNQELVDYFEKFSSLAKEMITLGMLPVMMEVDAPLYTDFLTQIASKKKTEAKSSVSIGEAIAVLSSFEGETETKKEQRELLEIALRAKQGKDVELELAGHARKFGWLGYGYGGPALVKSDFKNSLADLLKTNVEQKCKEHEKKGEELKKQINYFENALALSGEEKRFFAIARRFMEGKALRKEAMSLSAFASEPLFKEVAKRLKLSFTQVRLMTLSELKQALSREVCDENELNSRKSVVVFGIFRNGKDRVVASGQQAECFSALIKEENIVEQGTREVRGMCACAGSATGVARLILTAADSHKMQSGDILVSKVTAPDMVQAMRLASAIVTDLGGLTSHAAIISRELSVPCVIGTKIATRVFKDGDHVRVDATKGLVVKI